MNIQNNYSLLQSLETLSAVETTLQKYGVYALKVDSSTNEVRQKTLFERIKALVFPFFLKAIPPLFKRFSERQSASIESVLDFHFKNVQTQIEIENKNKYTQAQEGKEYKTIRSIALDNIYWNWNQTIRFYHHSHNSTAYTLNPAWQDSHGFTENERANLSELRDSSLNFEKIKNNLSLYSPEALVKALHHVPNLGYKKLELEQFSEAQLLAMTQSPGIPAELRANCHNHLLKLHLRALATDPWPEEIVEDLKHVAQKGTAHEWLKHRMALSIHSEKITPLDLLNFIAETQKSPLAQAVEFKADLKRAFDKILEILVENEVLFDFDLANKVLEIIQDKSFINVDIKPLYSALLYLPPACLTEIFCSSTDDLFISDCFKVIVQKGNLNTLLEMREPSFKMEFLSKFIQMAIATESADALEQAFEIVKKEGLENLVRLNTLDFSFLFEKNLLADFEIQLFVSPGNAKTIWVNSLILGARNAFFQKLTGNFREGFDKKARLEIEDIKSAEALIAHLYGKKLEINGENFTSLVALAHQWGLDNLNKQFHNWFILYGIVDLENISSMVEFAKIYPHLMINPHLLNHSKILFLQSLNAFPENSISHCIELLNLSVQNFRELEDFKDFIYSSSEAVIAKLMKESSIQNDWEKKLLDLLNRFKRETDQCTTLYIPHWKAEQLPLLKRVVACFNSVKQIDFSASPYFEASLQKQIQEAFDKITFIFPKPVTQQPQLDSKVSSINEQMHEGQSKSQFFLQRMQKNLGISAKTVFMFVPLIDALIDLKGSQLINPGFNSLAMYPNMTAKKTNYLYVYEVLANNVKLLNGEDKKLILRKMSLIQQTHHFRYEGRL